MWSSTFRRRASRRSRTASRSRATPRWSARPTGLARHQQQDHADQLQSVLDRAGVDRAQGPDPADAGQAGLPDQKPHPHLRPQPQGTAAVADQLVFGRRGALHVQRGSRRLQFARPHPHQFSEPVRRLHARHAAEESVRRGFPLQFVRLLSRAERAAAGRLAARRHQGLAVGQDRPRDQVGRAGQRPADQAGAAALGLCHRLVGVRRHRAISRGYLQPRWLKRAATPQTTKL